MNSHQRRIKRRADKFKPINWIYNPIYIRASANCGHLQGEGRPLRKNGSTPPVKIIQLGEHD